MKKALKNRNKEIEICKFLKYSIQSCVALYYISLFS
jgi:hypothetical protein